jgi:nucleoside-diphosphate-sugar epimerase
MLRPFVIRGGPRRSEMGHSHGFADQPGVGMPADVLVSGSVEPTRDAIYYEQLARVARLKADASLDKDVARRLREAAIRHERKARQLRRSGG